MNLKDFILTVNSLRTEFQKLTFPLLRCFLKELQNIFEPHDYYYLAILQSVTGYLELTLVFACNSALWERFNLYFSRVFG